MIKLDDTLWVNPANVTCVKPGSTNYERRPIAWHPTIHYIGGSKTVILGDSTDLEAVKVQCEQIVKLLEGK